MRNDGGFAVAWEDDQDGNGAFHVLGRVFNANGTQKRADFRVNSDASGQHRLPVASFDEDGRFVVGWQDDMDGDTHPLILVRNFSY